MLIVVKPFDACCVDEVQIRFTGESMIKLNIEL